MKKNIFIVILLVLVLGFSGYLVYDKVIDKKGATTGNSEIKEEQNDKVEEEKIYTYKDIAGNYYYEQDAGVKEMPGLMDRFGLILNEDGTFSYIHNRDTSSGVIGNYMINGNIITLNYIATTDNGEGISLILDQSHALIINEDKSITDEKVDLGTIFTSKITLSKDRVPSFFEERFYTFDKILQQQIQLSQM